MDGKTGKISQFMGNPNTSRLKYWLFGLYNHFLFLFLLLLLMMKFLCMYSVEHIVGSGTYGTTRSWGYISQILRYFKYFIQAVI